MLIRQARLSNFAIILIITTGSVVSVIAGGLVNYFLQENVRYEFEKDFENSALRVQTFFDLHQSYTASIRDFFMCSEYISADEFRNFTDSLVNTHQEVRAVCWIRRIVNSGQGEIGIQLSGLLL